MRKKIICSILITFICTLAFFNGYVSISNADETPINDVLDNNTKAIGNLFSVMAGVGLHLYAFTENGVKQTYPYMSAGMKLIDNFCASPYNIDNLSSSAVVNILSNEASWTQNQTNMALNMLSKSREFNYLWYQIHNYLYGSGNFRPDYKGDTEIKAGGLTEGADGNKYSVFIYHNDAFDFAWGYCMPLGSQGYPIYKSAKSGNNYSNSIMTPWGTQSIGFRDDTLYPLEHPFAGLVYIQGFGTTSSSVDAGSILYRSYGDVDTPITIGSPCLIKRGTTIYKGMVCFTKNSNSSFYNKYYIKLGDAYKTNVPTLPQLALQMRNLEDPSQVPASDSPTGGSPDLRPPVSIYTPSDPTTVTPKEDPIFDDDRTVYNINNYNTVNNYFYEFPTYIVNNPETIVPLPEDEQPDPDDDDPFNPNSPSNPSSPVITPETPNAGGNQGTDTIGGGGGSDNPLSSDGTINFPNFDFNLPNINWSIGDVKDKFPFSIPFDLVAFYTVLNAEPQAPAIDRTIPLGFTDWHFQADFSQFENYATIIRNVEYIGFCIFLIYLTIRFVKG